jgi:hypothetical protein
MYILGDVHSPIRKTVRVFLAVVAGLFSLPALVFGSYLFACWIRIHTTDVFYVEYPYLLAALVLGSIGVLSAFCSGYAALRRSFYGLVFIVPVLFGFATMVYIPDGTPHVRRSMMDDANYLSAVRSFFQVWYGSHHRFPKNEAEFLDALRNGPAAWQYRVNAPSPESDYAKGGMRLPYQIVVTNEATGPRLEGLSQRPGVIYYCVTADQQQFWVTMTGLHEDVSRTATLKRVADRSYDKPWLITATGKDYPPPRR